MQALNRDLIEPTTFDARSSAVLHVRLAEEDLLPALARGPLERWSDVNKDLEDLHARRTVLLNAMQEADAAAERDVQEALAHLERRLASRTAEARHLEQRANRAALAGLYEGMIRPAPDGRGVLVAGGRLEPTAVDALLEGRPDITFTQLPWRLLWPSIYLWGGLALITGFTALCMALIVHPQWSQRELLAYPIARFVEEVTQRPAGGVLPLIASNRLFWYGFGALVTLHLVNGMHAWFEAIPEISRQFDFTPLRELFPRASQIRGAKAYFAPTISPSVIAFTFFLTTAVSFSLGIAQALYLMPGFMLLLYASRLKTSTSGRRRRTCCGSGPMSALPQ